MPDTYYPSALSTEVVAILRSIIGRDRITQAHLSSVTGVSQSHISKLLRNTRPMDLDTLDRIANFLGRDTSEILAEAERNIQDSCTTSGQD